MPLDSLSESGVPFGPDEAFVSRLAAGDDRALEVLIARYQRQARNVAYRFLGDAHEAEEMVQETFLRLCVGAPRISRNFVFRAWFFRVLVNLCRDARKRARPVYSDSLPDHADHTASAQESMEDQEKRLALANAILLLPENQRLALLLCFYEGLSNQDAAESLGLSVKAIESLLVRARKQLREDLVRWLS